LRAGGASKQEQIKLQHVRNTDLAHRQAFSFDLKDRTQKLELIADKAAELRLMIQAALNPFDTTPDLEWLKAEVELFKLAARGVRT
jgi:hypothetical protein